MSQKASNVPQNEHDFRLEIELKLNGVTDAQAAVIEHIAYNAAAESVKRSLKTILDSQNVPRPEPHYLKGYRRKSARLGISLVEYERRYLQNA